MIRWWCNNLTPPKIMSKKNTPTKDVVAAAIIEQIRAYSATAGRNSRPLSWRVDTAKAILGIKDKAAKPIVKNRTAEQMQDDIIERVSRYVSKLGVRKLQAIVAGEDTLRDCLVGIPTTITTQPEVKPATEDDYNALLEQMTQANLFEMLKACSTYKATKATKPAKATTKGGYVSVDDKTAYTIAAVYLSHYKYDKREGGRTYAPECFLGGRTANATMALRRFLYSTLVKDDCAIYNSMPVAAYEWYKANPYNVVPHAGDKEYNPEKDIAALIAEDATLLEMIKGWQGEPYVKAVRKK